MGGWFKNSRVMLISIEAVVEVDVELCNRCSLVAWFTTFSVGWWVCVETENKAITAFNYDAVEVEAELGNINDYCNDLPIFRKHS